ncbi:hypothetical protein BD324DRAFT_618413 [Kockovaella imperatae]|uniref:NmrA-like domain-containing protein n=1 Tax=Kockovaella imperatae TaxID=4999 RepID=A0A1Y1ULY3_9TREE|nr:hypothetical protein BD324DRAFT_618413 [Kockovaella imperatae]ORX39068.1 hypothetical protein BD324DRAFT_618413 [Kockovaella imperatae]
MSSLPIVTVLGATGYQGGSVVDALLATGKFTVRGVTRNPDSAFAKSLAQKGVQVVKGDANDSSSLKSAFEGAWGAFLVTSFWDPSMKLDPNTDFIHGKALVDAAVAANVKFLVWSSLHDIEKATDGKIPVPHFTMKYKVEEYIKSLNVPAAFVFAGFYAQNWVNFPPFGVPTYDKEGQVHLDTAVQPHAKIPVIDIEEDFGKFVAPIFEHPDKFQGQDILASTEYLTVPEMAAAFEKITGKNVKQSTLPYSAVPLPELANSIKLFNEKGYYLGLPLEPSLERYSGVKFGSFENWLRRSKFDAHPAN